MAIKNLLLLLCVCTFLTCHRTSSSDNNQQSTDATVKTPSETETNAVEAIEEEEQEDNKSKAARMQGSGQKLQAPNPLGQLPVKWTGLTAKKLCQNKYGCLEQTIYPIGWSEEGKFAYCVEFPKEARDMYRMDFLIQDLTNDEIVFQSSFKGEPTLTLAEVWRNKNQDFISDLSKFDIQIPNDFDIKSFPLEWGEESLTCSVDRQKQMNDYSGVEIVSESQLTIDGGDLGKKQIAKQTYGKYDLILDTEVIGYLKSPYEERILVVYAKEKRGFEGPPNVLELSFVGCDLMTWE